MIIKNIRFGSDNGGFACGPVSGSDYAEVSVLNDQGCSVYCLDSCYEGFEKINVCSKPVFDVAVNMMSNDADLESEMEKIERVSLEEYDVEIPDDDYDDEEEVEEEVESEAEEEDAPVYEDSEYCKLIDFTRATLYMYLSTYRDADNGKAARAEFMEKYLEKKLEEIEIPEIL